MRCTPIAVATIALAMSVSAGAQAPASDPVNGTWRINPAKSTYSPGPPPPQMITQLRRFATLDGGWNLFELSSVSQQGDPVFQSVAFKIDGRQYPVYTNTTLTAFMTAGTPPTVTRSWRRIDTHTTEFTTYTNGVPGLAIVRRVSKDGKTYTETSEGKNSQGQAIHNVIVFDRVR